MVHVYLLLWASLTSRISKPNALNNELLNDVLVKRNGNYCWHNKKMTIQYNETDIF